MSSIALTKSELFTFKPEDFQVGQPGWAACKALFREFDKDNSGFVELDEICVAFELSKEDATEIMTQFDDDGNNKLDFDEFLTTFVYFGVIFREFDSDGSGFVELNEIINKYHLTEAEARKLLKQFDADGNNKLDYKEFLKLFTHMSNQTNFSTKARKVFMSGNQRLDQFLKFKPADFAPNQPGYKACEKFFKDFDADGSGFVELDEICKAFDMCEAHAKVVIEEFDDDGNNKLDFDEFLCLFASQVCYNSVIFREFDKDNSGYVELDEIVQVLGVGKKEAAKLLEKFDSDGNNKLDFDEFFRLYNYLEKNQVPPAKNNSCSFVYLPFALLSCYLLFCHPAY
jgi:Ca2+-binding EF-hand superfamily protein